MPLAQDALRVADVEIGRQRETIAEHVEIRAEVLRDDLLPGLVARHGIAHRGVLAENRTVERIVAHRALGRDGLDEVVVTDLLVAERTVRKSDLEVVDRLGAAVRRTPPR